MSDDPPGSPDTVPLADPQLGPDVRSRVESVIESGQLADGPEVRAFEAEFADYCGVEYGVATANGTAALHAALVALGVGPGDAVVTTPFSFVASANAVRFCGAEPVFADVDPETFNLDSAAVADVLAEREDVAAILAVHLYGLPADVTALRALADRHDVALLEDAAQAHGAAVEGRRVGSFGDAAAFSFYPTKNLTTGEGGMVLTDRADVAERAARFVDHGRDTSGAASDAYRHVELGHNFRLTSLAAAIGRAQLEGLPAANATRREHAARLVEALEGLPGIATPTEPAGAHHVYNQYTIRVTDRDALRAHLAEWGIDTGVYYPRTIPEQPVYADVEADVPVAARAAREVCSLPVHPNLTADQVDRVAAAVRSFATGELGDGEHADGERGDGDRADGERPKDGGPTADTESSPEVGG